MARRFGAFSHKVIEERLARARAAMAAHKLDACLLIAPEHLYYFTGYDTWVGVNSPQLAVVTRSDQAPVLIVRNVDLSLATESTVIEDIRTYHLHTDSFPALVQQVLRECGIGRRARLGIELQSYAIPASLGRSLADALAPQELIDSTEILGALRLIKSEAEIALLEKAGAYAARGLEALCKKLKPGMTEIALAARIEHAMRKAGSDYWSIPTELASGVRSAGGHGTPREKEIEPGDLVHAEFAGVCERYHATALQTVALGKPGKRARDLYRLGIESLEAGIAAVKVDAPVAEAEEASLVPLRREGLEKAAMMRFGYGIGIAYPPIWLETLQIARGFDTRLRPGMVFVLHSCLELPDEELGVVQGGTYVMEEAGLRMLAGAGPVPLLQV